MEKFYQLLKLYPGANKEEIRMAVNREMRLWSRRTNAPQISPLTTR